jgi:DNA-binding beta-propeller fold protein YncE
MQSLTIILLLTACGEELPATTTTVTTTTTTTPAPLPGINALGNETHDIANVNITVIGNSADGLSVPRDLKFNPGVEGELWVVNRADDSTTTYNNTGTQGQTSVHIVDPYAMHFMEEVSSISFGAALFSDSEYANFGTCHESRNTYNDQGPPNDFMGPTLWSSDPDVYGISNPEAVQAQGFDLGSHIDMLHETPLCMGLAWETANVYWAFNGSVNAINRVDFVDDHGVGWDDHSDGIIGRYVEGDVSRVEDIPSHLAYDPSTAFLYIADTGNSAIKVLDTTSGTRGSNLPKMEWGTDHYDMNDAIMWTLVEGSDYNISLPSGVIIVDETLLVTDNATGIIHAFDLEGNRIDWLDTGLGEGALMGIEALDLDNIWVVDAATDRVLRIQPHKK